MFVEIRDNADDVRQTSARVERRAALVVDEHEGEVVRARSRGQPGDQSAQQFALACAGRSRHQRVWAVAVEVDVDYAVGGDTYDGARRRVPTVGNPRSRNCGRFVTRQKRQQFDRVGDAGSAAERVLGVDQAAQSIDQ